MTDTILNIHTDFFNQQAATVYNTIEQELQLAIYRFLREHKLQQEFDNGNVWFDTQVEILFCDKDGLIDDSHCHVDMPEYIGNRKPSDKDRFDEPDVEEIDSSSWYTKTEKVFDWISWGYSNYPNATDATVSVFARYDDGSEWGCTVPDPACFVVEFKRENNFEQSEKIFEAIKILTELGEKDLALQVRAAHDTHLRVGWKN